MKSYPKRPIKIVVPYGPGGGTDTFARVIKKAIDDNHLLPKPVIIQNIEGGGSTVGSRRVKTARPDGYTVLLLHDALLMAKQAGQAPYGPEAFEVAAGTSVMGLTVVAAEDAPWDSLQELMEDARRRPDEIVFACNLGTPSHLVGLALENEAPGASFRFVQSGGGAKRFTALLGGHADLTAFSTEEFLRFRSSGLRSLGYCAAKRHPAMPNVPTAEEQGFDVQVTVLQMWWFPQGTAPERLSRFADALEAAMQTDDVRRRLAEIYAEPVFMRGEALREEIDDRQKRLSRVDLRTDVSLPDYPAWVFGATLALSLGAGVLRLRAGAAEPRHKEDSRPRYHLAAICTLATIGYVSVMQFDLVGYREATIVFFVVVGVTLSRGRPWLWAAAAVMAAALALGLHYVFTDVFDFVLPEGGFWREVGQ